MFAVARGNTPDRIFVMGIVAQGLQHGGLAIQFAHLGIQRSLAVFAFKIDKLVNEQIGHYRAGNTVKGTTLLLPAFYPFTVLAPEVRWQSQPAGIEQVGVFQHMVIEVIFGGQTQGTRLDAHIDVFRHQHNAPVRT